jgi:hypothetical protein
VEYIDDPEDMPDDQPYYTYNVKAGDEELPDACRTKYELIGMGVTHMIANNYTPCD